MPDAPIRYRSYDEDSARWLDFPFRDGDIVISTRSKSGTTWMQMICALLVFQTSELPAPLPSLSPWLDWLVVPRDEVYEKLGAQDHRRFIKTHTPLDGLPIDERATYIVVARHPLDMAASLYHQGENLNRERIRELVGNSEPEPNASAPASTDDAPSPEDEPEASPGPPSAHQWLLDWVEADPEPRDELDSLRGVTWHLSDAWARREASNVVLVHYDDLTADLEGEMRRLSSVLGIDVPEETWPELVRAAGFEHMRANAEQLAPDPADVMKSKKAFFRQGRSGAGRDLLSDDELDHYYTRVAGMAPADLLSWLHRDSHVSDAEVERVGSDLAARYADALDRLGKA